MSHWSKQETKACCGVRAFKPKTREMREDAGCCWWEVLKKEWSGWHHAWYLPNLLVTGPLICPEKKLKDRSIWKPGFRHFTLIEAPPSRGFWAGGSNHISGFLAAAECMLWSKCFAWSLTVVYCQNKDLQAECCLSNQTSVCLWSSPVVCPKASNFTSLISSGRKYRW